MDRSGHVAIRVLLTLGLLTACGIQAPAAPTREASGGSERSSAPAFVADQALIHAHLAALQAIADEHGGIRFSGSPGYEASVDYAAQVLRGLELEVETPEVEFSGFTHL